MALSEKHSYKQFVSTNFSYLPPPKRYFSLCSGSFLLYSAVPPSSFPCQLFFCSLFFSAQCTAEWNLIFAKFLFFSSRDSLFFDGVLCLNLMLSSMSFERGFMSRKKVLMAPIVYIPFRRFFFFVQIDRLAIGSIWSDKVDWILQLRRH